MKILINTATTFKGGGIQVANSFLEECKNISEHEYIVILGERLRKEIKQKSFPSNFTFYEIDYRPATRVFSLKNRTGFFEKIEKQHRPDVVFTTSGPSYWRPKAPHLVGYNLPHYIYPESPFFNTFSTVDKIRWYFKGEVIKFFFRKGSDAYVAQTDDVRDRVKKLFKTDKVFTVTNTCNPIYLDKESLSGRSRLPKENREKEFRLLLLSAYYEHKNFKIIPKVIEELKSRSVHNIKFILTIPNGNVKDYFTNEQQKYIYSLGRIPMNECPKLYEECDVMFLPTLLECFSASYPEAMAMDKPILTSDLGFAHSVCADAALYFNPNAAVDVTDKILQLKADKTLYSDLIEKGRERLKYFDTAKERAEKYIYHCEQLVTERKL